MSDELTQEEIDNAALLVMAVGFALGDSMNPEEAVAFARRHRMAVNEDPTWANGRHEGDCTKVPMSCLRCQWEEAQGQARWMYENIVPTLAAGGAA